MRRAGCVGLTIGALCAPAVAVGGSGTLADALQSAASAAAKQLSIPLLLRAHPALTLSFPRALDGVVVVTVHARHRVLARATAKVHGRHATVTLVDASGARAYLRAARSAHRRPPLTLDLALKPSR